ncbi:hypothetical protein CRE_06905 [Caenorhabditis remanei]|uniref:Uncharacterized protein n=1 Tax=Caenorhabditis remanei TaxID=31234 RepID=E3MZJ7_CAERE|nr:hypothetical protein CRE_06905 [Caenorhabditis remanei]
MYKYYKQGDNLLTPPAILVQHAVFLGCGSANCNMKNNTESMSVRSDRNYCEICNRKVRSGDHKCGDKSSHDCAHSSPSPKNKRDCLKKQKEYRLFVVDIESKVTSSSSPPTNSATKGPAHVPNVICGQFMCDKCVGELGCHHCEQQPIHV